MKRAHRNAHRLFWLILPPVMAVILWQALVHRPGETINTVMPELPGQEPVAEGTD